MEKLDRLGWPASASFEVYGLRIGIRADDETLLGELVAPLPASWRPSRARRVDHLYSLRRGGREGRLRTYHLVYHNHVRLYRGLEDDAPARLFTLHAERLVAELAPRGVFVHAGAVAFDGHGIVLPGASGSGKTTLVGRLVAAGAVYYSDEFAVLDPRGRLLPYARAPRPRPPAPDAPCARLPERVGEAPVPVSLIVFSRYRPDARFNPCGLSPGEAVIEMMRNVPSARRRPQAVLDVLQRAVSGSMALMGERGEADAAAALVLRAACTPVESPRQLFEGEALVHEPGRVSSPYPA